MCCKHFWEWGFLSPSHSQSLAGLLEQFGQLSMGSAAQPLGTEQPRWALATFTFPDQEATAPLARTPTSFHSTQSSLFHSLTYRAQSTGGDSHHGNGAATKLTEPAQPGATEAAPGAIGTKYSIPATGLQAPSSRPDPSLVGNLLWLRMGAISVDACPHSAAHFHPSTSPKNVICNLFVKIKPFVQKKKKGYGRRTEFIRCLAGGK